MTTWFISRHSGAVAWAAHQGLRVDRQADHLDSAQVRPGDTVIGNLPIHLAAQVCQRGASYWNLSIDLPGPWRGRELSASELCACNARLERFHVAGDGARQDTATSSESPP